MTVVRETLRSSANARLAGSRIPAAMAPDSISSRSAP